MKKVGIITFHHAKHSYGAFLQAYATLRTVEMLGFDAEIINYENKYEQKEIKNKGKSVKQSFHLFINWFIRSFVYGAIKNPCRSRKNLDKIYKKVSKLYTNIQELDKTDYDIIIAGSDQIWNPAVCGKIDPAFFLNFGGDIKRISYASSIGSYHFSKEELMDIEKYLSRFSAISVREKYALDALTSIVSKDIKVVCDPTILISGEQWAKEFETEIGSFRKTEPYVLTYFVGENITHYWDRIKSYVGNGVKIYNVQSHSHRYAHVNRAIYNILPGELLAYIKNADYVLTDSFHGTVFSILFHKNFVAVINRNNPVRVLNLLEKMQLLDRTDDKIEGAPKEIDYSITDKQLMAFRDESKEWLSLNLKSENKCEELI